MNKPFYGLDFGTSNSTISIANESEARVLPVDSFMADAAVMPSQIYFKKDAQEYMGGESIKVYERDNANRKPVLWKEIDTGEEKSIEIAGENGIIYYKTTIKYRVDINKPGQLVQALKTTLREGSLDTAFIFDRSYSLETLIAKILKTMKIRADDLVGEKVDTVVLGRPVHYLTGKQDDSHVEKRMEIAAMEAGFHTVSFLAEPIAAALSYLAKTTEDMTILVFDFGGGTLDFSVVSRPVSKNAQVIATGGLPIGGNTFNEEIMMQFLAPFFGVNAVWGKKQLPMPAFFRQSLRRWYELDQLQTLEVRNFLKEVEQNTSEASYIRNLQDLINYDLGHHLFRVIEEAKRALSQEDKAQIVFDRERLSINTSITRDQFEEVLAPYLIQIDRALDDMLSEFGIDQKSIDVVVATGGSTLIPSVQELLFDKFGKDIVQFHDVFSGVGAGLAFADQLQ